MLDSKQQESVTRVFVAAGFLMKHRLKLPEETPYSPTPSEVVAFLDGLNGTQMRKLKKIAEGVIPDGENERERSLKATVASRGGCASPSARRPVRSCSRSRRIAANVFPLDRRAARTC
jgi:hypothetical protein